MKRNKSLKLLILAVVMIALVLGYYYYLSNIKTPKQGNLQQDNTRVTAVQSVLLKNMDISYPPSPKEVVKYYSEITKCFYNETYTEEELEQLAQRSRMLLDDELVAGQNEKDYLTALKAEIDKMKEQKITISTYATSAAADVVYHTVDGFEFAQLYCVYSLRNGTKIMTTNEVYLLRKDDQGHWKIYGWKVADDEKSNEK